MDIGKLIGLDKLDGILGRMERRPLKVFAGQCLKERDQSVCCDVCAVQCPSKAIDLSAGVEVDFSACVDCGICVNLCPTGVFESRLNEDYFLSRIQAVAREADVIGFTCAKQLAAANSSAAEIEVPCLGRVSETMLVAAAVFGAAKVWLNTSLCAECDCRDGLALAGQVARGVDRLLQSWGRPVDFSLSSDAPVAATTARPSGDEEGAYSRRELMNKLKREAMAAGLDLAKGRIDRVAGIFEPPVEEPFTYRLPRRRELFLSLVKKLGEPQAESLISEDLSLYSLAIDARRCNFCGNCAVFCPTQAVETRRDGDRASILFNASKCLGCDLCIQACAPRALDADPRIFLKELYEQGARPIVELEFFKCAKCKQPFAAAEKNELCDFCRAREDKLQDDSWS